MLISAGSGALHVKATQFALSDEVFMWKYDIPAVTWAFLSAAVFEYFECESRRFLNTVAPGLLAEQTILITFVSSTGFLVPGFLK